MASWQRLGRGGEGDSGGLQDFGQGDELIPVPKSPKPGKPVGAKGEGAAARALASSPEIGGGIAQEGGRVGQALDVDEGDGGTGAGDGPFGVRGRHQMPGTRGYSSLAHQLSS